MIGIFSEMLQHQRGIPNAVRGGMYQLIGYLTGKDFCGNFSDKDISDSTTDQPHCSADWFARTFDEVIDGV